MSSSRYIKAARKSSGLGRCRGYNACKSRCHDYYVACTCHTNERDVKKYLRRARRRVDKEIVEDELREYDERSSIYMCE